MCKTINSEYTDYCADHILQVLEDAETNYTYAQWSLDFENKKVARIMTEMANLDTQSYSNRQHLEKLEDTAENLRQIGFLVADRVNSLSLAIWKYDRTAEGVQKNLHASRDDTLHSGYRKMARDAYEAGKSYRDGMTAVASSATN